MRSKGTIIKWNAEKAFGFVRDDSGAQDVFVHISAFKGRRRMPEAGSRITYNIILDKQARAQAAAVRFEGEAVFGGGGLEKKLFGIMTLAYAALIALLVHASRLPRYTPMIVLALALITYMVYRADKRAAEKGRWRIAERDLHLFSLLGGWPGAWLAQMQLRHKSSKTSFKIIFYVTILLNLLALAAFYLR